jgi:anti-sigma factor RsiW
MKTKIPEQILTDYALNELSPEERLYVESMLGASEEAREDVYQMIDLAMMLDEGFERAQERAPAVLTADQRRELMNLRLPNTLLRNAVVLLAAAACATVAFIHHDTWMPRLHLSQPTAAHRASDSKGAQASASPDFVTQLQRPEWARDPLLRKWFSAHLSEMFSESVSFEGMPGMPGMPMDLMP